MSYKFVYFDLDDTLLDHQLAEAAALEDVHQNFPFFKKITADKLIEVYHQVNTQQWMLYSSGEIERDDLQRNRFEQTLQKLALDVSRYKEVGDFYMQCYRDHWRWIEGAQLAYQKVAQEYPVGILTNGFAETQKIKFKRFELNKSAEHVVISEDVGALKPDPRVFEHATDLANVAPEDILYVGDSFTSDIEGGSSFGWNTAWYTSNGDSEKHQKADFVFNNFNDLTEFLDVKS